MKNERKQIHLQRQQGSKPGMLQPVPDRDEETDSVAGISEGDQESDTVTSVGGGNKGRRSFFIEEVRLVPRKWHPMQSIWSAFIVFVTGLLLLEVALFHNSIEGPALRFMICLTLAGLAGILLVATILKSRK